MIYKLSARLAALAVRFRAVPVAFGGGLGALARHVVEITAADKTLSILLCNIVGTFILASASELKRRIHPDVQNLISIGFCGGLTVFSGFSADSVRAAQSGHFGMYLANILCNFAFALLAVFAAQRLAAKARRHREYIGEKHRKAMSKIRAAKDKIKSASRIVRRDKGGAR